MDGNSLAARISEMVEKRYGCSIKVLTLDEANSLTGFSEALQRNPMAPLIFSGSRLFLMVRDNEKVQSVACIENAHLIEIDDLERICFLTDGLLSSALIDASRDTSFYESDPTPAAQVLSLADFRKNRAAPSVEAFEELYNPESNGMLLPLPGSTAKMPDPLLLVGPSSADFHKIAFDIHSESGVFCFLPWAALGPADMKDSTELFKLGEITIFIADLASLPEREQLLIASFIATASDDEKPRIIACSTSPATILVAEGKLVPELAFVFHELEVSGANLH